MLAKLFVFANSTRGGDHNKWDTILLYQDLYAQLTFISPLNGSFFEIISFIFKISASQ